MYRQLVRGTVRTEVDRSQLMRDVLREFLTPMPAWLRFLTDASRIKSPTGVAWWDMTLIVADDAAHHVLSAEREHIEVLIPGLQSPHHLQIDREKLLVTNRGGDEVLVGVLHGTTFEPVRTITRASGRPFKHPLGVHQAHGLTVISDTDNHRVIVSRTDPVDRSSFGFRKLEAPGGFRYPMGVFVDSRWIWVADTDNHRLIAFDHAGTFVAQAGFTGVKSNVACSPVGVTRYERDGYNLLLVANEGTSSLDVFRVSERRGAVRIDVELAGLGQPLISSPFGLSLNRNGRLAVTDRHRRGIWLVDFPRLLATAGIVPR
jgi:hypothetical protein